MKTDEPVFEVAQNIQDENNNYSTLRNKRNQSPEVANLYLPTTFENPYVSKKKSAREDKVKEISCQEEQ